MRVFGYFMDRVFIWLVFGCLIFAVVVLIIG